MQGLILENNKKDRNKRNGQTVGRKLVRHPSERFQYRELKGFETDILLESVGFASHSSSKRSPFPLGFGQSSRDLSE